MSYQKSVFSSQVEEITILREEVQRLCNENHLLKKEKEELEETVQTLYKEIHSLYGRDGGMLRPKKEYA